MAGDKQIVELPAIDLATLLSGLEVDFVAQVQNAALDNRVPKNIMRAYLAGNFNPLLYSGATNPSNALGNNGDWYLKGDGGLFLKTSGAWSQVVASYSSLSPSITFDLPIGSPIPSNFSAIGVFTSGFRQTLQLLLNPEGSAIKERVIYDVIIDAVCTDSSLSEIQSFDIYGHDDPDNPGFTVDHVRITLIK